MSVDQGIFINYILSMLLRKVVVPTDFHSQVKVCKEIQMDDMSGLVDSLTDFAVDTASLEYGIETDNESFTKILKKWLDNINRDYVGIPTGINPLAEEYFKERWKYSSFPILKLAEWDDIGQGVIVPTKMFFVDGESIHAQDKFPSDAEKLNIVNYDYYLGHTEKAEKLNKNVIITRPYGRWYDKYPTPFLVKRGIYHNWRIVQSLKNKETEILDQIIPYMLLVKKGTEGLAINKNVNYSDEKLQQIIDKLQTAVDDYKEIDHKTKSMVRATNFDEELKHFIPDLSTIFEPKLFEQAERNILSGLGFIDIAEATSSSRRESILNPKAFIQETKKGVKDFKQVLKELVLLIIEKNKSHVKFVNSDIKITSSAMTGFMTDKFKERIKQCWDRGKISNKTAVEIIAEVDFETEVKRREKEAKDGIDVIMYPNPTDNREGVGIDLPGDPRNPDKPAKDDIPDDKIDPTQKKEFNTARNFKGETTEIDNHIHKYIIDENGNGKTSEDDGHSHSIKKHKVSKVDGHTHKLLDSEEKELETSPYKTKKDLPARVKNNLSSDLQGVFLRVVNQALKTYNNESLAFRTAWSVIRKIAKKNKNGKWVRKTKKEKGKVVAATLNVGMIEEAMKESEKEAIDEAFHLQKLSMTEGKKTLLDKLFRKK